MKIFLDTSSLFKLYHKESDTDIIERVFADHNITTIYLSEIAKIEFASTIWKKVRVKELTESQAKAILDLFEQDFGKYTFIPSDAIINEQARNLITKYGKQGLRTLDSIQLATSVSLSDKANLFITTDKLLATFFKLELLPT